MGKTNNRNIDILLIIDTTLYKIKIYTNLLTEESKGSTT